MLNTFVKEFRKDKSNKYEKNRTRPYIKYICGMCGKEQEIVKNLYKDDKPCKSCRKHLRGKGAFFKKAKEKFGGAFDLSEVDYIDSNTKVKVRCKKHNHTYYIKPLVFVGKGYPEYQLPQKGGCKYCAIEASKTYLHKPIEHYLNILHKKFPDITVVTHGTAENNLEKITLCCPVHGNFEKILASIVSNKTMNICPVCSRELLAWNTRFARTDIKGKIYFLYLKDIQAYKLGVTYRDVQMRANELKLNAEILWEYESPTLAEAYLLELYLFRVYQNYRYTADVKFGGYTELLTIEIPKPSKAFIEEILCLKESNSGELLASKVEDNPELSLEIGKCNDYPRDGSTLEADASGNGSPLTSMAEEVDIV